MKPTRLFSCAMAIGVIFSVSCKKGPTVAESGAVAKNELNQKMLDVMSVDEKKRYDLIRVKSMSLNDKITVEDIEWLLKFAMNPAFSGSKKHQRQGYASSIIVNSSSKIVRTFPKEIKNRIFKFSEDRLLQNESLTSDEFDEKVLGCAYIFAQIEDIRGAGLLQKMSEKMNNERAKEEVRIIIKRLTQ
jgi:hypothetical protein